MVEKYPELTLEVMGLAEKLNVVWEKKVRVQIDSMVFSVRTWKNRTIFYAGGGCLEASGRIWGAWG